MKTFVIFRQERFIGRAEARTAHEALDLWVETYDNHCPAPPGPFMAVEENEARQRKLIP